MELVQGQEILLEESIAQATLTGQTLILSTVEIENSKSNKSELPVKRIF